MVYIDNSDSGQELSSHFQHEIDALTRSSRADDRTIAALATIAIENERLVFDNDVRDLPPAVVRLATFIVPIALTVFDGREPHEAAVAGCEGAACILPTERPRIAADSLIAPVGADAPIEADPSIPTHQEGV